MLLLLVDDVVFTSPLLSFVTVDDAVIGPPFTLVSVGVLVVDAPAIEDAVVAVAAVEVDDGTFDGTDDVDAVVLVVAVVVPFDVGTVAAAGSKEKSSLSNVCSSVR
jgi:hypothetical protein